MGRNDLGGTLLGSNDSHGEPCCHLYSNIVITGRVAGDPDPVGWRAEIMARPDSLSRCLDISSRKSSDNESVTLS